MRRSGHIGDDRLVEICLESGATPAEHAHFDRCEACAGRRARLEHFFVEVRDGALADADAAFTDERLATQRARILQRIEHDGRPARVIAFPAASGSEPRPLRSRPAARWIAAAAAAGLTIGLLAGHLAHDLPSLRTPVRSTGITAASRRPPQPGLRIATATVNDDEFLGQVEEALDGPSLAVLRPLNDLTPR